MKFLNIPGFHCYSSSLSNIAYNLNMNYYEAYCNLWSEVDLEYNLDNKLFLSRRLIQNLQALGLRREIIQCKTKEEKIDFLHNLSENQWAVIEMDCFYLPWHNLYEKICYSHHFPIKKNKEHVFLCIDPLHNKAGMELSVEEIQTHATHFEKFYIVPKSQLDLTLLTELKNVMKNNQILRKKLLQDLENLMTSNRNDSGLISKYISVLICNRQLYKHFLEKIGLTNAHPYIDLSTEFFSKWYEFKNMVLRSIVRKEDPSILLELQDRLNWLLDMEYSIAEDALKSLE